MQKLIKLVGDVEGVEGVVSFAGFNGATFSNATNSIVLFPVFKDFSERDRGPEIYERLTQAICQVDAFGMIAVTLFGVLFAPFFYVLVRRGNKNTTAK